MPKLRRLSGIEVVRIFELFDFRVVRVKGSHHVMKRILKIIEGDKERAVSQTLNVPVHGHKELALGTLHSIYRESLQFIPEEEIRAHFYTE